MADEFGSPAAAERCPVCDGPKYNQNADTCETCQAAGNW